MGRAGNSVQAIVSKIMTQRPTPISAVRDTVPETVENAVMIALAKLPADRFATAAEFANALTAPTTAFARPTGDVPRSGPGRRKLDVIGQRVGIPAIAVAILASALALWGWLRPQAARQPVRFALAFDSSNAPRGGNRRFAISPDGSTIAYVGGADSRIFLRPLNSVAAVALSGTEGALAPFFSPDGKQIGYSNQLFELRTIPIGGGSPALVTDSLIARGQGTWSPDGYIYTGARLGEGLYRMKPDVGGVPESFTKVNRALGEVGHTNPVALPNGKGVLFVIAYRTKPTAIAVGSSDGKYHRLIDGFFPIYAASGHILYNEPGGALMAVAFDQSRMEITGEPHQVVATNSGNAGFPATVSIGGILVPVAGIEADISRNGTLVYGPRSTQPSDLVWVDRAGRAQLVDSAWRKAFSYPAISPDGTRLVVSVSDVTGAQLWIKKLDHGPASRFTLTGSNNNYPEWTPDGNSVSYYSNAQTSQLDLWLKKADASAQAVRLPAQGHPVESCWSPDGKWLVYRTSVQENGKGDILAIKPAEDSTPVPLAVTPFSERDPTVSRDGRWLAFTSNETGRYEVYVVPFPDAKSAKWPISSGGGSEPIWAHNGHELFYRDGSGNMVSVEFTTRPTFVAGASKILFNAHSYAVGASHTFYDVARDDQRFIMVRNSAQSPNQIVIVASDWFDELKNLLKK